MIILRDRGHYPTHPWAKSDTFHTHHVCEKYQIWPEVSNAFCTMVQSIAQVLYSLVLSMGADVAKIAAGGLSCFHCCPMWSFKKRMWVAISLPMGRNSIDVIKKPDVVNMITVDLKQKKVWGLKILFGCSAMGLSDPHWLGTVGTLYSTVYYSKYFIELNIDKSTQYVALWTHKRHPIPRPFGRAMECLLWVLQQKLIVL